jgi:hypothetical protein
MSVNCTEGVIKQIDVSILVQCSRKLNSLFLTSTQVNASITNDGLVSILKQLKIFLQRASLDNSLITLFIHWTAKKNVLLDISRLYPGSLRDICCRATYPNLKRIVKKENVTELLSDELISNILSV